MSTDLKLWPIQEPLYLDLQEAFSHDCKCQCDVPWCCQQVSCCTGKNHTAVAMQAPTGFGKTTIVTKIVYGAWKKKTSTHIYAHTNAIIDQISERLTAYGIPHGIIAAGYRATPWETIQVCMVQSCCPKMKKEQDAVADGTMRQDDRRYNPRLRFIDEAHHCVAKSYDPIFADDALVIGVSATWWRMNGQGFDHRFTKLIAGPSLRRLTKEINTSTGRPYLVKPRVATPDRIDTKNIPVNKDGEYDEKAAEKEIEDAKIFGSALKHYKIYCQGESAILFCQSVNHAKLVAKEFCDGGVPTKAIYGEMSKQEIKTIIKEYSEGRILGLSTCMLVGEGFDLPKIAVVFQLKLTRSLVFWLQTIGRGLRADAGKTHCKVFDHVGMMDIHGSPLATRTWGLDGKTEFVDDGEDGVRQCEKCFFWTSLSEPKCEFCGYEKPKRSTGDAPEDENGPTVNKYGMLVFAEDDDDEPPIPKVVRKATRGEIGMTLATTKEAVDWHKWCKEKGYSSDFARIRWSQKLARIAGGGKR